MCTYISIYICKVAAPRIETSKLSGQFKKPEKPLRPSPGP